MLFADFDRQLKDRSYLAMGGQIDDASLVAAPKQRNTVHEKDANKAGKTASEISPEVPARAAQIVYSRPGIDGTRKGKRLLEKSWAHKGFAPIEPIEQTFELACDNEIPACCQNC